MEKKVASGIELTLLLTSMLTLTLNFQPATCVHALPSLAIDQGIDVWMQYPAPYGGQGFNKSADLVFPQQIITLTAEVIYNWSLVAHMNVTFQIFDNKLNLTSKLIGVTDYTGRVSVAYEMPWPGTNPESLLGMWHVIASANVSDVALTDRMGFYYDYLVRAWSITTNKPAFEHHETAKITVSYGTLAEQSYDIWLTAVIQDNLEVPVGIAALSKTIGGTAFGIYANYTSTLKILIPYYAFPGSATVRVNFLDKSPSQGGTAIAPEVTTQVWILPTLRTNPTADFTWEPLEPRVRRTVTFDATSSEPGWNTRRNAPTVIVNYVWNFGDDTRDYTTTNPYITHTYSEPGKFTITLTVVDNESQRDSISQAIKVIAIADVAITNLIVSKTVVCQNYTISIRLVAKNEGDLSVTFNLSAYADLNMKTIGDEITIQTQNVKLPSGNSTTVFFAWNTTGVALGNYTVSAYVIPVPDETDIADNVLAGGWVVVTMAGDITGPNGTPDGKVDIRDVGTIAKLFGVNCPDPRYVANYDINDDGKIDIKDLIITAKNFGKTYP